MDAIQPAGLTENQITGLVVDSALKIHRIIGPGLLESVYEDLMALELSHRGISFERQKAVPVIYQGVTLPNPFRADLVVDGRVLVELKSVESLQPIHSKQTLTYLRLANLRVGLLINFNVCLLKEGIQRLINSSPEKSDP
ncbi:MAG TPA: GxxExxY protein [Opitutaceae bacterium]|nr:GxxExxY protein [Opitutaceae bacterium]